MVEKLNQAKAYAKFIAKKERAERKEVSQLKGYGYKVRHPEKEEQLVSRLGSAGYRISRESGRRVGRPRGAKSRKPRIKYERRIRAGTARLASFLVPGVSLPRTSYYPSRKEYGYGYSQSKRRVGRPRGPSGKYVIPGVGPVGVYQWRQWYAQQRALQTMEKGREVPEEYQQYEQQMPQQERPQLPAPQLRQMAPQQASQPQMRSDNILHAPNFMKGELHSVGQRSALINVDDLNRPITNKGGDYYTEVDPISGKQILRKRTREKWLS